MMKQSHLVCRLLLLPAVVVAVLALSVGCAAVSGEPAATPTPTPTPTPPPGVLVGHLYVKGGLDPKTYPYAAKLTATAIHTSTPAVYNFEAGKDGAFRIELPPGIYMVTSVPIGNEGGGPGDPHEVTIRSGGTYTLETTSIRP